MRCSFPTLRVWTRRYAYLISPSRTRRTRLVQFTMLFEVNVRIIYYNIEFGLYLLNLLQRKLFSRSDRVKGVDFHPTEPWILTGLYNGTVNIYNHETGALVKTFEVSEVPARCVKFIARKNWFVVGSDDFQLRVFNYNTHEKVAAFEAHPDYIRCLTVHPTASIVLTGSDDMTIKAWDWEKQWKCIQVSHLSVPVMISKLL